MAIALFGRLNEEWLRTFPALPHGIPSHDTPGRVFARLDAARFEEGFRNRVQAAFQRTGTQVVPVGPVPARFPRPGPGPGAAAPGSAPGPRPTGWGRPGPRWTAGPTKSRPSRSCCACSARGLHRDPRPGTLRVGLPEEDCAPDPGAGGRLRVRTNHKGLHARLEDTFAPERAGGFAGYVHDHADTVGKGRGRIEIRRCRTTGDPDLLAHADPDREWCDLAGLVRVESERRCGDRVSTGVRGFIPACRPGPSGHWRRCASTGPSRTPAPGSWTSPSARPAAASAPAMPPTTGNQLAGCTPPWRHQA